MLAILPEIYKSGIWKKYAGSIEEYAGKFGDIAGTTVIKRLRLEENLEDKPCLKAAIEKVGVHKVALVAKIATPETDSIFAENILNMSKMAVQSLSKELRAGQDEDNGKDGRQISLGDFNCGCDCDCGCQNQAQPCRAVAIIKKIELDEESTFLFMRLKAKFGKNLSDKEFLKIMLEERAKQEFSQKQSKIADKAVLPKSVITVAKLCSAPMKETKTSDYKSITAVAKQSGATAKNPESFLVKTGDCKSITDDTFEAKSAATKCTQSTGRYVRANKKRETIAQTNGKCAYPGCNLPCEILHHVDRYSESKSHDSLIPLCKIHHEFMHNNLIQNEKLKTNEWRISVIKAPTAKISQADVLYQKYRRKALN